MHDYGRFLNKIWSPYSASWARVTDMSGNMLDISESSAPPVASTRGDLNGDGAIDLIDAAALQARWQATTTSTDCAELASLSDVSRRASLLGGLRGLLPGVDFSELVTRAKFEELCADLFRQTLVPVEKVRWCRPHASHGTPN